MSDIEKKPEQEQSAEKIDDLPPKQVEDKDAKAVKGGDGLSYGSIEWKYTTQKSN